MRDYTPQEAATLCGVSRDTIKRRLRRGQFPNAHRQDGPTDAWRIPEQDLRDAGLYLGGSVRDSAATADGALGLGAVPDAASVQQLRELVTALRLELARVEAQARAAETIAAERAEHISLLAELARLSAAPTPAEGDSSEGVR